MTDIERIIKAVLETEYVPVCAACEAEKGRAQLLPGQEASHGYCRKHLRQFMMSGWSDEEVAEFERETPPQTYWHDLQSANAK